MEPPKEPFLPHVREYIIPREEYLGITDVRSTLHEFYRNCESYTSKSIQIDVDSNTVTLAGLAKPKPGCTLSLTTTLLHLGPFNEAGEAEFFARFNGPVRLKPDGETDSWRSDFTALSSTWNENGICMRFAIHRPTFKDWSYFQILEPYAQVKQPLLTRDFPDIRLPSMVHQTVFLAYSMGYFESPRKATLREIAARLDISHTMVARHLREAEFRSVSLLLALDPQNR